MKAILFVDDEPAVLRALEFVLRKRRTEWRMVFVQSGQAALAELGASVFDVIVSDLRMPGMDGAALLELVSQRHPDVARIALSGQADELTILRARAVAETFLSKPCPSASLCETLDRVIAAHSA